MWAVLLSCVWRLGNRGRTHLSVCSLVASGLLVYHISGQRGRHAAHSTHLRLKMTPVALCTFSHQSHGQPPRKRGRELLRSTGMLVTPSALCDKQEAPPHTLCPSAWPGYSPCPLTSHHLSKTLPNVESLFRVLHSFPAVELHIQALSDSALLPPGVARDCFSSPWTWPWLCYFLQQRDVSRHDMNRVLHVLHDLAWLLVLL